MQGARPLPYQVGAVSQTAHGNPPKEGESKPSSASKEGRFIAIRGEGSNAPASAGGPDARPVWSSVEDVPEEEEEPLEGKVSEAERGAPQQRAGPSPFDTPRIPKSVGPRADAHSPSPPPSARRVPHHTGIVNYHPFTGLYQSVLG